MKILEDLKYTKEHEWFSLSGNTIGITDFAQGELGDVVFVDLKNVGDTFQKNDVFGTVEAIKTVADLYIPVSGKIVAVNENLESNPELINSDPYGEGWIIKIELLDSNEIGELLSSEEYKSLTE